MHPDDLLEQLKQGANARKVRNLDILHAVCKEQFERGSSDYSVATVARLAADRGGPAAQTIHNKTGDDFKGLIAAWAKHTGGASKKTRRPESNPILAVLDTISDPSVRAVMGSILAENRKLRGELNLLKQRSSVVIDRREKQPSTQREQVIEVFAHSPSSLTATELAAIRHAMSQQLLDDEGWTHDQSGRILNARGRAIFKPGFVSALRKILRD